MKPTDDGCGYLQVSLSLGNGESETRKVHRLVAMLFIPNPQGLETVNHKNGIKTDCRVENLEWMSREDNINHMFDTGLCTEKAKKGVLSINANNGFIEKFESLTQCAKAIGCRRSSVEFLANGKHKKPYKGKYFFKYIQNKPILGYEKEI